MLLENLVFSFDSRISNWCSPSAVSAAFDHDRGAGVAENEVAVAVAEIQVAAGDLGIEHQHRARLAALHRRHRGLDAEGGRRTGHVHVEAEAVDAQRVLHFDRHGRIGALHVAAGDQHHVDVGRHAPGALERLARRGHAHFGLQRQLVVAALGDARGHARRIEDAFLFHHVARLDAGRLFDEAGARAFDRRHLAGGDRRRIVGVELLGVGVEGDHQFFVGDRMGRREQARAADDDLFHGDAFK